MNPIYIIIAIILILERVLPFRKAPMLRSGIFSDVVWYNIFQEQFFTLFLIQFLEQFPKLHHFYTISNLPFWIQLLILFVIQDFLTYWYHRYAHNSFIWRFHELHHSTVHVDWLSGARQHILESWIPIIANSVSFCLFFGDIRIAETVAGIVTVHGIYAHSNIRNKIGWLQYIVISAEMHRCHHLKDIKYQRSNYGNVLSIWDWLFGTAYYPREEEYKDIPYGTDEPYPQNFVKAYIHGFRKMKLSTEDTKT